MSQPNGSQIVGVDVGGANLKYASTNGFAFSRHFAMWRTPELLARTLAEDFRKHFGGAETLAVTMTGELADCFADRCEGVEHIVRHVCDAAKLAAARNVLFYGVDGRFRPARDATGDIDSVAAANWHALASYIGIELASDATLIDIGSTTTDIIPIRDGRVASDAKTDHQRLGEGSLVYVGCRRTPVCALVDRLQFRGAPSSVMNELFATIDDARIVLGFRPPVPADNDSSDGRPRTCPMAAHRLARMIGLDRRDVTMEDSRELAAQVHDAAKARINCSLTRFADAALPLVISGHGDDLVDLPPGGEALRLADQLGPDLSRCAPSYAVAKLLRRTIAGNGH